MSSVRTILARTWPLVLCVATLACMYQNWQGDPFDPGLVGTARYGHNHATALSEMVPVVLVELVVLYAVLAPGGSSRMWRAAVALLAFGPWTLFSMLLMMHAGGIVALHALWLVAVCLGIVAVLVARIVSGRRSE